jgi:hypothetical protein
MRPWAQWTAKTALLAAGGGGLSGVALAAGRQRWLRCRPGAQPRAARRAGRQNPPAALVLLMSHPNRLAQAIFRVELRMCGLGV